MLAEIAACNAAFGVIKQVVSNGQDLLNAGKAIAKFVSGKEELQRQVAGKDKSKANQSDLEAFLALEKIRQQELELKQMMIYLGRPGLWTDYQRFCAEARRARRQQEKEDIAKRKKIIYRSLVGGLITVFVILITGIISLVILAAQGKL
ncbi:MAG: hypothetical protein VW496_00390 [Pelagibacteraceae bacterium]